MTPGSLPPPARRYSAVHLLAALGLLFVSSPFIQDLSFGRAIEGLLVTAILLSALFAVSGGGSLLAGLLFAAAALLGQWLGFFLPHLAAFFLLPALAFMGFVIARLLGYVLRATEVNHETLCACVAGFLMIGLLWAMGYTVLAKFEPSAFSLTVPGQTMDSFNAFYFSFVTLSTIGYGDITPVSRVARMLSVMEAITGMFYVAVLVARLVSIYSSAPSANANPARTRNKTDSSGET